MEFAITRFASRRTLGASALLASLAFGAAASAQAIEDVAPSGPHDPPRPACVTDEAQPWSQQCYAQLCEYARRGIVLNPRPALWANYAIAARGLGDPAAALQGALRCAEDPSASSAVAARCREMVRALVPQVGFLEVVLDQALLAEGEVTVELAPPTACGAHFNQLRWSAQNNSHRVPITPGRYEVGVRYARRVRHERSITTRAGTFHRVLVRRSP